MAPGRVSIANIFQNALGAGSQDDSERLIEGYTQKKTWKGNENANSTYSHQGLMQYISGHIISEYWLNHLYSKEVRQYYEENRFHIHDLGFLSAYCAGWSIEDLLMQGFGGVENKIQCRPAAHFNTALNQTVNFLFTLQGELAGAQALSNFDTYLAPFIRYDNLSYAQVFKYVQSFVYSLNVPTRSGFQAPFTNLSLDLVCPKTLVGHPVIIGGKCREDWVYEDFQEEMDTFNRAFCAVMVQGDGNGNIFSFPIPTYNLYEGFDWDAPRHDPIWEMTAKYGVPYFANFINSDLDPEDFRSMCCRLRLDITELRSRGGLFGSMPLTGSVGVVTINLPNLAMRSGTEDTFLEILDDTLRVTKDSLEIKRKVIDEHRELYPYAAHYLDSIYQRTGSCWSNHFNTVGVIGMNEAMKVLLGYGIAKDKTFAESILNHIKEKLKEFQLETGHFYNLEATPAESTCYKLARRDRELFGSEDIPTFYTNSSALPVDATSNLLEAVEHQESLQTIYTGGTVFHAFLGEKLPSGNHAKNLVKMIATGYRIPYLTLSPTFSICKTHGYIAGEKPQCPQCGESTLVYSRIVGYYRPTRDWNNGKKVEFSKRKYFNEKTLPVAGFTGQTLTDYPGKIACIMFTSRCNLACPWCHNGPVVQGERDDITLEDVVEAVQKSKLKNLVISGGEPTIHKGLLPFMRLLKRLGISVKLDTNGTSPETLRTIFKEGLVDFVAMDIKCALERYKQVAGKAVKPEILKESIELIKSSGIPHDFRTTVVPDLVDIEDLVECKRLAGGKLTLQKFRKGNTNLREEFQDAREHTDAEFEHIVDMVGN
ncbi:DEKNAAC100536 [Brettanomyces naardenensis]|uniref:DEKNAAC100536 n=1 Tax=Brettanomyces naardenensis TaxID=13370 RepID=A0A448YGI0_BRENA|nr:DEKNAAC100536 [Brettanomyces naardenensis]